MKYKNITLIFVKIIITTGIFFLLKEKVQLSELLPTLEKVSISGIITASSILILSTILTGLRWYYVLRFCRIRTSLKNAIFQIYKGFSVSQIMPSNIGGDIYRILAIRKNVEKYRDATALVMLDRTLGMLSMLLCSVMMTPFFINIVTKASIEKFIFLLVLTVVILILCLYFLNRFITKKIPILHQLMHYGAHLFNTKNFPKLIFTTLSITVLYVFSVAILAKDIGIMIDFKIFLFVIPLITILSVMPISFAGWGVREGLMVLFLGFFGVPSEQSLILSILFGVINLIAAIPGALMFLTSANLSRQTT